MKFYLCEIPELFGYGVEAYGSTKAEALRLAKAEYRRLASQMTTGTPEEVSTFEKAMDYAGGSMREITLPSSGTSRGAGEFV